MSRPAQALAEDGGLPGIAFDGATPQPVPVVGFVYPVETPEACYTEADVELARMEAVYFTLQAITHKANAKQIAQRIMLLAYECKLPGYRTRAELAEKLKVSMGRVSQGLKQAQAIKADITRDWRRQSNQS